MNVTPTNTDTAIQDDCISLLSHNLRTPLTIIRGYLYLVLTKRSHYIVDPDTRNKLEICLGSTERMIHMIHNAFFVSKIQNNTLSAIKREADVLRVVHNAIAEVDDLAKRKHITLILNAPKHTLEPVNIDTYQIKYVFINVISNALVYSVSGDTVTVTIRDCASGIEVRIHDTGSGISQEDMDDLFQKYGRLEKNLDIVNPDATGLELGLYIVKTILDMHDGTIRVKSRNGKGTTVIVRIPKAKQG